ncbi:N-methylhydantoinase B/oxoprolinase/acetone carboxylase alpha subunit [Rhodoligotrophos appendicifer]|uniref:hydantoinase B/oxoprolinase family protein n=1 Tax=Rhodoligotrophos appendicifer TaxID=987056 RepID=UPI00118643ED|nr:hydantoinase B/oxoprolinase family protein [Rhodoligotrophos appendicifer]
MTRVNGSITELPPRMRAHLAAASPAATQAWPACFAILDSGGQSLAQQQDLPIFSTMLDAVARTALLRDPGDTWRDGQLYLSNDPYLGGVGLATIAMVAPVFVQGRLLAFAGGALRLSDIGAMRKDIFTFGREIMHEGVRLSGLRVDLERGQLPEMLQHYLAANVRDPRLILPALNRLAATLVETTLDTDPAALERRSREMHDAAASALAKLTLAPTGRAQEGTDAGLELQFEKTDCQIRVTGNAVPMDPDGRNAPLSAIRAGVVSALAEAAGECPSVLNASVVLDIPARSRFNIAYPAAAAGAGWGAFLSYQATAQALDRTPALDPTQFTGAPPPSPPHPTAETLRGASPRCTTAAANPSRSWPKT